MDKERAEEIAEHKPSDETMMREFIELLSENDKPEYERVFDHFLTLLIDDSNEEEAGGELDEESSNLPWASLEAEMVITSAELIEMIQKLTLGLSVDDELAISHIKTLKKKGAELKDMVLESAERVGFSADPWEDRESFEAYCEGLAEMLAEQERESSKRIQFYGKLIGFVESMEVVHRLPRKQNSLNKTLKAIAEELREQVESESPVDFPHAEPAKEWFEWAFHLEGNELETLQVELDENFPKLADFLGECQWDWLKFRKRIKLKLTMRRSRFLCQSCKKLMSKK